MVFIFHHRANFSIGISIPNQWVIFFTAKRFATWAVLLAIAVLTMVWLLRKKQKSLRDHSLAWSRVQLPLRVWLLLHCAFQLHWNRRSWNNRPLSYGPVKYDIEAVAYIASNRWSSLSESWLAFSSPSPDKKKNLIKNVCQLFSRDFFIVRYKSRPKINYKISLVHVLKLCRFVLVIV